MSMVVTTSVAISAYIKRPKQQKISNKKHFEKNFQLRMKSSTKDETGNVDIPCLDTVDICDPEES